MKTKEEILEILSYLPRPLVGGLCYDHNDRPNLRDVCIDMIKDVVKISKPKEILEIGTHSGSSTNLLLCLSDARVTTVDIGHTWIDMAFGYQDWLAIAPGAGLNRVIFVLSKVFGDRFSFVRGDSTSWQVYEQIKHKQFDLIFIDGNHDLEYVTKDIETAIKLKIPYILLDDYNERDPTDARIAAAKQLHLIHIKTYQNIHNDANIGCGLFKNPNL